MERIPSDEARRRFEELLDRSRAGESFVITEAGEELGRLIPPSRPRCRRLTVVEAIAAIVSLRPLKPLDPQEIKRFIDDGRRN